MSPETILPHWIYMIAGVIGLNMACDAYLKSKVGQSLFMLGAGAWLILRAMT